MAGEIDHMLAGAAAGFHHVTGFPGQELLQYRPYRLMVAVKRRRVETTVGFDRPAVLAEFHDIFSHDILSLQIAAIDLLEHMQHVQCALVGDDYNLLKDAVRTKKLRYCSATRRQHQP